MSVDKTDDAGSVGAIVGACVASIFDHWGDQMSECSVRIVSDRVVFEVTLLNGRESGSVHLHRRAVTSAIPDASKPSSELLDDAFWANATPGVLALIRQSFGHTCFESLQGFPQRPPVAGTLGSYYEEAWALGLDDPASSDG
jgi:hypothetical protein